MSYEVQQKMGNYTYTHRNPYIRISKSFTYNDPCQNRYTHHCYNRM